MDNHIWDSAVSAVRAVPIPSVFPENVKVSIIYSLQVDKLLQVIFLYDMFDYRWIQKCVNFLGNCWTSSHTWETSHQLRILDLFFPWLLEKTHMFHVMGWFLSILSSRILIFVSYLNLAM